MACSVACSGVVFGFAALKPVLVRHGALPPRISHDHLTQLLLGVYAELCHVKSTRTPTCVEQVRLAPFISYFAHTRSPAQELRLNFIFTYASQISLSNLSLNAFQACNCYL